MRKTATATTIVMQSCIKNKNIVFLVCVCVGNCDSSFTDHAHHKTSSLEVCESLLSWHTQGDMSGFKHLEDHQVLFKDFFLMRSTDMASAS